MLSIKGEAVKPETIEWISREVGAKTALWYPDDPRFFNSLVKYIAPSYDYVFTPLQRAIKRYKEIGCRAVHFLPFACEETIHKKWFLWIKTRRNTKRMLFLLVPILLKGLAGSCIGECRYKSKRPWSVLEICEA